MEQIEHSPCAQEAAKLLFEAESLRVLGFSPCSRISGCIIEIIASVLSSCPKQLMSGVCPLLWFNVLGQDFGEGGSSMESVFLLWVMD